MVVVCARDVLVVKLRLHYYTENKFFTAKSNFTEAETTISFSLNARPIFSWEKGLIMWDVLHYQLALLSDSWYLLKEMFHWLATTYVLFCLYGPSMRIWTKRAKKPFLPLFGEGKREYWLLYMQFPQLFSRLKCIIAFSHDRKHQNYVSPLHHII